MSEFKVGDSIEHVYSGDVYKVSHIGEDGLIEVEGYRGVYRADAFKLSNPTWKGDQTKKADAGKPLFGCLMRELAKPLAALVDVLTFGAQKYARSSWMTVDNAEQRYEDALYRHLNAWARGEKKDAETGISHLAHAAINILFLLHFELEKKQ